MKYAASLLTLAASASAHMILEFPVPYGAPNSSPLDPSGADFPCKNTGGGYAVNQMNEWNAGETKTISFIGSAVHGGGSCQFSLTTDMEPSKQSQWKVIHSVIGGCPSNATGNLPDAPAGHGAATFPLTLPADIPAGTYSFAWTWFNKIGQREMYMNCAPLKVGGGANQASTKDVSSILGSMPDMFVANLPSGQCSTIEEVDFEFPNPGQSVVIGDQAAPGSKLNGDGCAAMTALGAGSGNMGSPSQPTNAPAPSEGQPPATTAAPPAVPSNPGGVFAPGASSAVPDQPPAPTASPPAQAPPTEQPPAQEPSQPGNNTPPSSGEGTPCDTDGAIVCIGSNQFGVCNYGFAVPQALAAGTVCTEGTISAAASRRSVRFPRSHLHRRHGSGLI